MSVSSKALVSQSQTWHLNFSQLFDDLGHENHIFSESISSRVATLTTLTTLTPLTTLTTWTTWTNGTTLKTPSDQTIYQDKCRICIVYLVLLSFDLLWVFVEKCCILQASPHRSPLPTDQPPFLTSFEQSPPLIKNSAQTK